MAMVNFFCDQIKLKLIETYFGWIFELMVKELALIQIMIHLK